MSAVIERLEAPHVVYPKGPRRTVVAFSLAQDQIAGDITLAELDCKHTVTLAGAYGLGQLAEMIVRCPVCFHEAHKGTEQVIGT